MTVTYLNNVAITTPKPENVTVEAGATVTLPGWPHQDPSRSFTVWEVQGSNPRVTYSAGHELLVTEDIALVPRWGTQRLVRFSLDLTFGVFDANWNEVQVPWSFPVEAGARLPDDFPSEMYVVSGSTGSITLPEPIEPPGYRFAGWYAGLQHQNVQLRSSGALRTSPYSTSSNETLYAHWDVLLTLDLGDGEPPVELWHRPGVAQSWEPGLELLTDPIDPSGREFAGWETLDGQPAGPVNWNTPGPVIWMSGATRAYNFQNGHLALRATWVDDSFDVSFSGEAGPDGLPNPVSVTSGNSMTLPTPVREGFSFDGWYDADSGGNLVGQAGESYVPSSSVTLYAVWSAIAVSPGPPVGGPPGPPLGQPTQPPGQQPAPERPVVAPPVTPGASPGDQGSPQVDQPGASANGQGSQASVTLVIPVVPVRPTPVAPAPVIPRDPAPPVAAAPPAQQAPVQTPAPAVPAPALPPRTADSGSVLERNLGQRSGTVDLGGGVQSLATTNQGSPGTLLRTDQVPVRTPSEKRGEVLQGFAPGSTTEIEVVGARTGARFVLSAQAASDKEQVAQAMAASATSSSTDFFEVRNVQAVSSPEPKPSWGESERTAVSSLFESSSLPAPKSLNDFDVSGFTEWIKIESEARTYVPGSTVYLTVTSEPIVIGQAKVNAYGYAELVGTIPAELLGAGEHRIRLIGIRLLDGVSVDQDGNVQVTDDVMAEIERFDRGTQVTVAVLGQNPEGEQHMSLRIVALPDDATPPWWPLWLIAVSFALFVFARTRGLLGQQLSRGIGLGVVGGSALPAILIGVSSGVMAVAWWGLAAGILALGLALFVPHPASKADPSQP